MADISHPASLLSAVGSVTVRRRPSLLIAVIPLRAAEPVLEMALEKLKRDIEVASQWLKRRDAFRIEASEPHFPSPSGPLDPALAARAREKAAKLLGQRPDPTPSSEMMTELAASVTGMWEIPSQSVEETLALVYRLKREGKEFAQEVKPSPGPKWPTPQERMAQLSTGVLADPDDGAPTYLFISRLDESQFEKAMSEAFSLAEKNARQIARAANRRLGKLTSIHGGMDRVGELRHDLILHRQKCAARLAGSTYVLGDKEMVSDDVQSAEFVVTVHVTYQIE